MTDTPSAIAPANPDILSRLIAMLSCDDLDTHEISRIADVCIQAQDDPAGVLHSLYGADAAQVAQYDPAGVIAFIIFVELQDYFAVADNVDELYEQLIEAFENPTLPDYPYDDNNFETVSDFYRWVDGQLQAHHPNYALISFGQSYTNDFQLVLVYRAQRDEIISSCTTLGLQASRCE